MLAPLKKNLGPASVPLGFCISPVPEAEARGIIEREWPDMTAATAAELATQLVRQVWLGPVKADAEEIAAGQPGRPSHSANVERCCSFIVEFLGAHAWPERELRSAALDAGFASSVYGHAKTRLKSAAGEGQLSMRARGAGGAWWAWLGPRASPRPDRPPPD